MPRFLHARNYRVVLFLILHIAYLAVLFGAAGVRDDGDPQRSLARVLASLVEIGLVAVLCAGWMRLARPRVPVLWALASSAIAGIAAAIYAAQTYSLRVSGNFITALAMQNTDSADYVKSPTLFAGAIAVLVWFACFVAMAGKSVKAPLEWRPASERWSRSRYVLVLSALGVLFSYLLLIQGNQMRLEPGFRQSPLANFLVSLYRSRFAPDAEGGSVPGMRAHPGCFDFPDPPVDPEFPFQRTSERIEPLRMRQGHAAGARPNVIIIFSEGLSARMIGGYGGKWKGLTPHVDGFSRVATRVDDYFNHTAATYRGLEGQLSSGFSFAGGAGEEGWVKKENQAALQRIRRQTLPRIFANHGYETLFFAPHRTRAPIIKMLSSLGFDKVFANESISGNLLDGRVFQRPGTSSLDDSSLFRGLTAFLQERAGSGQGKPFFIGLYNIGTHAFLKASENDVPYEDNANHVLSKIHNFDVAFGAFLEAFEASPWAANTVLIFTSDHATYPEPAYREVAGADLKPFFVDRIPLLIKDPFHALPKTIDARGRNSLDLVPTVLHLAGIRPSEDSFLGASLFEERSLPVGIAATAANYYMTMPTGVFSAENVPDAQRSLFECEIDVVRRYYEAERQNRIYSEPGRDE